MLLIIIFNFCLKMQNETKLPCYYDNNFEFMLNIVAKEI